MNYVFCHSTNECQLLYGVPHVAYVPCLTSQLGGLSSNMYIQIADADSTM